MFAQLKSRSLFRQVRCDLHQITQLAKAVQVLNCYGAKSVETGSGSGPR
jgi:hypothetical protein